MSAQPDFGFGKFVPGFDFLQNLAKGTAQAMPQMSGLSNWVAPTLNVEELDKRITEMKAVQFWLEQNGKALAATIQALEVQKMTLATLNGMNVNMAQVADALKARTADAMAGMQTMAQAAAAAAQPGPAAKKAKARADAQPAAAPEPQAEADAAAKADAKADPKAGSRPDEAAQAGAAVDPLQWWGALTQQFQQIAANAFQEAGQAAPPAAARKAGAGATRAGAGAAKPAPAKTASRKPAARKRPAR